MTGLFVPLQGTSMPFFGSLACIEGCFLVVLSLPLPDLKPPFFPEEQVLSFSSTPFGFPKLELELVVPTTELGTQGLVLILLRWRGDGEAFIDKLGTVIKEVGSSVWTGSFTSGDLTTSQDSERLCPGGRQR